MLYHHQTSLGQSAKMKGDHAKESKSSPGIGLSTPMATRCAGTWAQLAPSHPLPDPSRSESSLQLACLGLCLLWPQCDGPAGFANRISVFALPPGITAEAAGIAYQCCSQQEGSVPALPAAASCGLHLFLRRMGSLCAIFPKTTRLEGAGWWRSTTVFPFTMVAQKVHFRGLKGTRK